MPIRYARKLIHALACLVSLGAAAEAKDWSHVKVATEGAYPPYNSTAPSGKIVGFEPDLLQTACDRLKITCELVAQDFDGSIPGLLAGKFDVIMSGMSVTPKRQEVIAFSEIYSDTPTTFAVLKSNALAAMPLTGTHISLVDKAAASDRMEEVRKALQGKTVGVQVATIQLDLMNQYLKDGVTIRTYKNNDEIVLDLKAGRVDAMVGSQGNLNAAVEKAKGDIVYSGPLLNGGPLGGGAGLGLRKEDVELKAMLDKEIKLAIADGTTKTLSMKWFHFDVTPQQ
jgi:octopine/nopaline transport system substrate-binding protein